LFLSPYSAPKVFLVRAAASLLLNLGINLAILGLIILLTGSNLAFPIVLIAPLFAVLLGAYGIAFAMGSLALLLKQVQQLLSIFQFGLLFLFTVPIETWTGALRVAGYLIPMAPGASLLRLIMAQGQTLDWVGLLIALLNGAAYFTVGMTLFRWAERETKRRGRLGGY
jgi:ABC-2 type transport system permease protein